MRLASAASGLSPRAAAERRLDQSVRAGSRASSIFPVRTRCG